MAFRYPVLTDNYKSFFVSSNYNGTYSIMCDNHNAMIVAKCLLYHPILMWNEIEPFPSQLLAYKFMKENFSNLM